MFFIAVYVSRSGIFEHINMVCNRCGTRIYAWDKIICVNMLIWFVASLAMDKSSYVFPVALQISGFRQNRRLNFQDFHLASIHIQLDIQCFQLARIDVSAGQVAFFQFCGQHACSVGQLMHSVGQNRCLSCLEQMSQLVISFWPTCMFSWPENMFFIFTYTTVFPKCSLTNMYCEIYMFTWPGYMFSWPGYMFSWLGCMFSCTFMNFSLHMFNKALGSQFFVHFANNNQKLAFNHVLIGQITRFQLACFNTSRWQFLACLTHPACLTSGVMCQIHLFFEADSPWIHEEGGSEEVQRGLTCSILLPGMALTTLPFRS